MREKDGLMTLIYDALFQHELRSPTASAARRSVVLAAALFNWGCVPSSFA
jgi:hypothetical protein